MLKSTIKWVAWSCVFFVVVFVFCAFAAIAKWFDRDVADGIAMWTSYLIFLLGAVLIGCILFEQRESDD
jgi:TRAP-type C4-dicarboxylate transport system permease small subunit